MKFIRNTVYGGTWVPDHCEDRGPKLWNADNYAEGMMHDVVRLVPTNKRIIALDLGASVGLTALGLGHHFETVIAIEADPLSFECLVKNTSINPKIKCLNYAISNIDADMSFTRFKGVSGHTHQYREQDSGNDNAEFFTASARRLDNALSGVLRKGKNIGFIKMDVEGMEPLVIEDNLHLIEKHRPILLIEIAHDYFNSFDRIYTALKSIDYAFGHQVPGKRDFIFVHKRMRRRLEQYRRIAHTGKEKIVSYPLFG